MPFIKISFCTTCRDRSEHLALTLPKNAALLPEGHEIVLLDYGSEVPITPLVRDVARPGIELFRLPRTPRHRMAHAKNVAHRLSGGGFLVNLDADNILTPEYLNWLEGVVSGSASRLVFTHAWGGGGGRIGLPRDVFLSLGGYDERFDGWGYDDDDLLERGRRVGIKAVKTPEGLVRFIRHEDSLRGANPRASRNRAKTLSDAALRSRQYIANCGKTWGAAPEIIHESLL